MMSFQTDRRQVIENEDNKHSPLPRPHYIGQVYPDMLPLSNFLSSNRQKLPPHPQDNKI